MIMNYHCHIYQLNYIYTPDAVVAEAHSIWYPTDIRTSLNYLHCWFSRQSNIVLYPYVHVPQITSVSSHAANQKCSPVSIKSL